MSPRVRIAALCCAQSVIGLATAWAVHRHVDPGRVRLEDPGVALVALALAVGSFFWFLSTLATFATLIGPPPGDAGVRDRLDRFTLPIVRRLAVGTLGLTMVGVAPVGAADEPVVRTPHTIAADEPVARTPATSPASTNPTSKPPTSIPPTSSAPASTPPAVTPPATREPESTSRPDRYTVVRGDNLWDIAASHLRLHGDPQPNNARIATHWAATIARNRTRLRSGDPNLIFPGEVLVLPPVPR